MPCAYNGFASRRTHTRLEERMHRQDNPYCPVRIVAHVAQGMRGSALFFDVALGAGHLEYLASDKIIMSRAVERVIDGELKKRGLVRVERPSVLDDFCYHARAVRLSDWKKWMKRGTACQLIEKQPSA